MAQNGLKISFNGEMKKTKFPATFEDLLSFVRRSFFENKQIEVKFFYYDDGDAISVSSDDDLRTMQDSESLLAEGLKLYIFPNQQDAQQFFNNLEANGGVGKSNIKDHRGNAPSVINNQASHQPDKHDMNQNLNLKELDNLVSQESSMNYYNFQQQAKPSIESTDYVTPSDRSERQGSVVGGMIKPHTFSSNRQQEQPSIIQNKQQINTANNISQNVDKSNLQAKISQLHSIPYDQIMGNNNNLQHQNTYLSAGTNPLFQNNIGMGFNNNPNNYDFEEMKSELDISQYQDGLLINDQSILSQSIIQSDQDFVNQLDQRDRQPSIIPHFDKRNGRYEGASHPYEQEYLQSIDIQDTESLKQQRDQEQVKQEEDKNTQQNAPIEENQQFDFDDDQAVRYIEDDDDDDKARFDNNLFNLGGRNDRGSTKMIRVGDNQSERSNSIYSNFTQIHRIDTFNDQDSHAVSANQNPYVNNSNNNDSINEDSKDQQQQLQIDQQNTDQVAAVMQAAGTNLNIIREVSQEHMLEDNTSSSKNNNQPDSNKVQQDVKNDPEWKNLIVKKDQKVNQATHQMPPQQDDIQEYHEEEKDLEANQSHNHSQLNQNEPQNYFNLGSRCGFCEGTGKIQENSNKYFMNIFTEELQKVLPQIREQISMAQNPSQMLSNVSQLDVSNLDTNPKPVHHKSCSECGLNPIVGIRYNCLKCCQEYNLCETCEMKGTHPQDHTLAKIRIPEIQKEVMLQENNANVQKLQSQNKIYDYANLQSKQHIFAEPLPNQQLPLKEMDEFEQLKNDMSMIYEPEIQNHRSNPVQNQYQQHHQNVQNFQEQQQLPLVMPSNEIININQKQQHQQQQQQQQVQSNGAIVQQQQVSDNSIAMSESSIFREQIGANLKAKLIKESFADKHQIEAGEKFSKTWTFKNEGETSWPKDVSLKYTNGTLMGPTFVQIGKDVKAGDYCDVTVEFTAPKKAGNYVTYYKLMYGVGKSIGKKVWCDIQVTQEDDLIRLQREMQSMNMPSDDQQPKPEENKLNNNPYSANNSFNYGQQASYMNASGYVQQQFAGAGAGYGQQYYNQYIPQAYGGAGGYQMPNQNNLNSSINNMNSNAYQFQQPGNNNYPSQQYYNQNQIGGGIAQSNLYQANNPPNVYGGVNANANFGSQINYDNGQFQQQLQRERSSTTTEELQQQVKLVDYHSQVNSLMSNQLKESMRQLGEMGYLDFKRNEELLKKHNNKVEQALMELLGA
eukprot:403340015